MKIASLVQSIIAMTLVYTTVTMAMPTSEERKIAGILRDAAHKDRFCNNIATVLEIICNGRGFNEPPSSKEIYNRNKRDAPGIKDECCVRPCGAQTLEKYCAGPQEPWNKLTERVSKSLKNVTVDNSINRGLPSPPSPNPKGGRSAPEVKTESQYHGPSTSQIGYIPEERTRPIINLPHHKQPPDLSH